MNDAQIKGTQQLNEVNDKIKFIIKKNDKFKADWREKEWEIAELKGTINGLNERLDKVDRMLDHQEQYPRGNCLLIQSNEEENQEDTNEIVINILNKEIDDKITHENIDRSHHLDNQKPD